MDPYPRTYLWALENSQISENVRQQRFKMLKNHNRDSRTSVSLVERLYFFIRTKIRQHLYNLIFRICFISSLLYQNVQCKVNTFLKNVSEGFSRVFHDRSLAMCHPLIFHDSPRNTEAVACNVRRINVAMMFYFYTISSRFKSFPVTLFVSRS